MLNLNLDRALTSKLILFGYETPSGELIEQASVVMNCDDRVLRSQEA